MSDDPVQPDQPDTVREADVANGENPDDTNQTGDEQADENRENDPPA